MFFITCKYQLASLYYYCIQEYNTTYGTINNLLLHQSGEDHIGLLHDLSDYDCVRHFLGLKYLRYLALLPIFLCCVCTSSEKLHCSFTLQHTVKVQSSAQQSRHIYAGGIINNISMCRSMCSFLMTQFSWHLQL